MIFVQLIAVVLGVVGWIAAMVWFLAGPPGDQACGAFMLLVTSIVVPLWWQHR